MESNVPYQAYRSKRHSRTFNFTPSPSHRPLSGDWVIEKLDLVQPASPPSTDTSNGSSPSHPQPPLPDTPPTVSSPSSSSTPLPPISSTPKKSSTFRRLQPRPPPARALPSSSLRPLATQSRTPLLTRQLDLSPRPLSPPPLHNRVLSISSIATDGKPHPNRPTPSHTPNSSESSTQPPPRSTSLSVRPQPQPASVSSSTSPSPITSPPLSTSSLPRQPVPYRPGFQPKGVYRPRTDEFSQARKAKHDATRIERTKLERRLEKLIHLHFPVQPTESSHANKPAADRRKSAIFDLDLRTLRNMDASDIWKGVVQSQGFQGAKADIRAAEQRIAPWQQDAAVSKCPLCNASFHPLTNRKHHCRLCGQIICSLPIKRPQRAEPCSILFIVDLKTREIEQVSEGVDYGVKRVASGVGTRKRSSEETDETLGDDDKFLKGVRVCRDCKPVLSREVFYQQVSRIPPLVRLYEAFIDLEKEIEQAIPQFQELVLTLKLDSPPSKEATATRKQILDDFASYDAISKGIRKIPCITGSSQDRVQLAIRTRADLFLQKNMFPLQSLPKVKRQASASDAATPLVDPGSELAHALQPLLEQEALLESFVGEAMAHRKFEDAKTLKANLKEIRGEIDRMLENRTGDGSTQVEVVTG